MAAPQGHRGCEGHGGGGDWLGQRGHRELRHNQALEERPRAAPALHHLTQSGDYDRRTLNDGILHFSGRMKHLFISFQFYYKRSINIKLNEPFLSQVLHYEENLQKYHEGSEIALS